MLNSCSSNDYYTGYCYPKQVIGHVVWLYHCFLLSLRDVLEIVLIRGIELSYETIRGWGIKLGHVYAKDVKHRAPRQGDQWHLDEMCLTMNGRNYGVMARGGSGW